MKVQETQAREAQPVPQVHEQAVEVTVEQIFAHVSNPVRAINLDTVRPGTCIFVQLESNESQKAISDCLLNFLKKRSSLVICNMSGTQRITLARAIAETATCKEDTADGLNATFSAHRLESFLRSTVRNLSESLVQLSTRLRASEHLHIVLLDESLSEPRDRNILLTVVRQIHRFRAANAPIFWFLITKEKMNEVALLREVLQSMNVPIEQVDIQWPLPSELENALTATDLSESMVREKTLTFFSTLEHDFGIVPESGAAFSSVDFANAMRKIDVVVPSTVGPATLKERAESLEDLVKNLSIMQLFRVSSAQILSGAEGDNVPVQLALGSGLLLAPNEGTRATGRALFERRERLSETAKATLARFLMHVCDDRTSAEILLREAPSAQELSSTSNLEALREWSLAFIGGGVQYSNNAFAELAGSMVIQLLRQPAMSSIDKVLDLILRVFNCATQREGDPKILLEECAQWMDPSSVIWSETPSVSRYMDVVCNWLTRFTTSADKDSVARLASEFSEQVHELNQQVLDLPRLVQSFNNLASLKYANFDYAHCTSLMQPTLTLARATELLRFRSIPFLNFVWQQLWSGLFPNNWRHDLGFSLEQAANAELFVCTIMGTSLGAVLEAMEGNHEVAVLALERAEEQRRNQIQRDLPELLGFATLTGLILLDQQVPRTSDLFCRVERLVKERLQQKYLDDGLIEASVANLLLAVVEGRESAEGLSLPQNHATIWATALTILAENSPVLLMRIGPQIVECIIDTMFVRWSTRQQRINLISSPQFQRVSQLSLAAALKDPPGILEALLAKLALGIPVCESVEDLTQSIGFIFSLLLGVVGLTIEENTLESGRTGSLSRVWRKTTTAPISNAMPKIWSLESRTTQDSHWSAIPNPEALTIGMWQLSQSAFDITLTNQPRRIRMTLEFETNPLMSKSEVLRLFERSDAFKSLLMHIHIMAGGFVSMKLARDHVDTLEYILNSRFQGVVEFRDRLKTEVSVLKEQMIRERLERQLHEAQAHAAEMELEATRARLEVEESERRRRESELEAARTVQETLFPPKIDFPGMHIDTYAAMAEETGGDWYGIHYDPVSHHLFFFIGDVTGHGFPSALMTGVVCGAVYSGERRHDVSESIEQLPIDQRLALSAKILNGLIADTGSRSNRVMTMLFLALDLQSGKLSFLNAAHKLPFLLRRQTGTLEPLMNQGHQLGTGTQSIHEVKEVVLQPGDAVFCFTDGLLENTSADGKSLSPRELKAMLTKSATATETPRSPVKEILKAVNNLWNGAALADDVTMVYFEWQHPITRSQVNNAAFF